MVSTSISPGLSIIMFLKQLPMLVCLGKIFESYYFKMISVVSELDLL